MGNCESREAALPFAAEVAGQPLDQALLAAGEACAVSLLDLVDRDQQLYVIHPTLREFVRNDGPEEWTQDFAKRHTAAVQEQLWEWHPKDWQAGQRLAEEAFAALPRTAEGADSLAANAQRDFGNLLSWIGRYEEAERLLRAALDAKTHNFPAGHSNIAISRFHLGRVLLYRGEVTEALQLLQSVPADCELAFGPGHWAIDSARGTLGIARAILGDSTGRHTIREAQQALRTKLPEHHYAVRRLDDDVRKLLGEASARAAAGEAN
jgi:tetratricopeptide (TPR) repeat protein